MKKKLVNYAVSRSLSDVEVFVAYCGDYSSSIGPPMSMIKLAELLSGQFNVVLSSQLFYARDGLLKEAQKSGRERGASVRRWMSFLRLKKITSMVRLIWLLLRFNYHLNLFMYKNKKAKVIITQPFFVPLVSVEDGRLFYTRRANEPQRVLIGLDFIKRIFERCFVRFANYTTVYLVKQELEEPGTLVIPNFFDSGNFVPRESNESVSQFYMAGTWCFRKGGDRAALVFEGGDRKLNVFGELGGEEALNKIFKNAKNLVYMGSVSKPYSRYLIGDVFLTFSRVEGMQRSLIEALLQGCLVVGVKRVDTESVSEFPGVFLVDWDDDDLDGSSQRFNELLSYVESLREQRVKLGVKNREFAIERYSPDSVLALWGKAFKGTEGC